MRSAWTYFVCMILVAISFFVTVLVCDDTFKDNIISESEEDSEQIETVFEIKYEQDEILEYRFAKKYYELRKEIIHDEILKSDTGNGAIVINPKKANQYRNLLEIEFESLDDKSFYIEASKKLKELCYD